MICVLILCVAVWFPNPRAQALFESPAACVADWDVEQCAILYAEGLPGIGDALAETLYRQWNARQQQHPKRIPGRQQV